MMLGHDAAKMVVALLKRGQTILDVGAGAGAQACYFRAMGLRVTTLDFGTSKYGKGVSHDITGDFYTEPLGQYDCVWACHVLEHQPNPGLFLTRCRETLKPEGWLAVTVPPRKDEIVGGHVTIWNAGLLVYQAVLAGFDCSAAMLASYGYNVSMIVRRPSTDVTERILATPLCYDIGDIEQLADYFPPGCRKQGFRGVIEKLNWHCRQVG